MTKRKFKSEKDESKIKLINETWHIHGTVLVNDKPMYLVRTSDGRSKYRLAYYENKRYNFTDSTGDIALSKFLELGGIIKDDFQVNDIVNIAHSRGKATKLIENQTGIIMSMGISHCVVLIPNDWNNPKCGYGYNNIPLGLLKKAEKPKVKMPKLVISLTDIFPDENSYFDWLFEQWEKAEGDIKTFLQTTENVYTEIYQEFFSDILDEYWKMCNNSRMKFLKIYNWVNDSLAQVVYEFVKEL